jgi:hypothetical protein
MPSFRFSTRNTASTAEEDVCELPDITSARRTAIIFAGEILREVGGEVFEQELRIVVTDDVGQLCWDLKVTGIEGPGGKTAQR